MTSVTESEPARRLMLVHAHPDDETIGNGATMAKYVAEGAAVCLVTCTLGEEGEVLVEDLAHLAPEQNDDLGAHRLGELKLAMEILGVTDFIRLGGDGRYRDSGMAYADRRSCHRSRRASGRNLLDGGPAGGRERAGTGDPRPASAGADHLRPDSAATDIPITSRLIEWLCTPPCWLGCRPTVGTSASHGPSLGCSGAR